jgi:large subunit ribosomal protein L33
MAKKKEATETISMQCESCKRLNYSTRKNKRNNPDRMERKKYCKFEQKHTVHKEKK